MALAYDRSSTINLNPWAFERLTPPHAQQTFELRPELKSALAGVAVASLVLGTALLAFKVLQAATDEDFDSVEYPSWFRDQMINTHVQAHGHVCPECDCRTRRADFHVDHRIPLARGGRTSRSNARVVCCWCNWEKGATMTASDRILGRSF
jgi:hypothetical protein